MPGTVLGDLDTILLQSCMIMILFTDTAAQVRCLALGHIATLPDYIAQVLPSSLVVSVWPFGPLFDDATCHHGPVR